MSFFVDESKSSLDKIDKFETWKIWKKLFFSTNWKEAVIIMQLEQIWRPCEASFAIQKWILNLVLQSKMEFLMQLPAKVMRRLQKQRQVMTN